MGTSRIALVTGGNRGIGFAICRGLAQRGLTVILTARNAKEGTTAAETLRKEDLPVEFVPLDVNDEISISQCVDTIVKRHGRIDVLVNNAGVMLEPRGAGALTCDLQLYRDTFETNVLGPLRLAQAVAPVMKRHGYGRVVNVSSRAGQLSRTKVHTGTPVYSISKTALNALTRMLASELQGSGIMVNAMTPGWVRTRMGGQDAPLSPEQAADTAVWLATLPDDGPTGGFFHERKPIAW
ncbi:MAG TPA: SDR family oxidoreductase [Burkholderiales bacterium]|nr:SDR family oxidoreductase [Burkholderiales bacterium]